MRYHSIIAFFGEKVSSNAALHGVATLHLLSADGPAMLHNKHSPAFGMRVVTIGVMLMTSPGGLHKAANTLQAFQDCLRTNSNDMDVWLHDWQAPAMPYEIGLDRDLQHVPKTSGRESASEVTLGSLCISISLTHRWTCCWALANATLKGTAGACQSAS